MVSVVPAITVSKAMPIRHSSENRLTSQLFQLISTTTVSLSILYFKG